jgi:hypothetical protein
MIVEEKIGRMMKKAPAGKILFDGYTISGQHYAALFASFILSHLWMRTMRTKSRLSLMLRHM